MSTFLSSLDTLIETAEQTAARGCGQSDVLWDRNVQAAFAGILEQAPEQDRAAAEAALKLRGWAPDREPREPADDECSETGIHIHWCPCGRHE